MPSSCARCPKPLQIRVNLSTEELSGLENDLRSKFGPSAVTLKQEKELMAILALADEDIEDHACERGRRVRGPVKGKR